MHETSLDDSISPYNKNSCISRRTCTHYVCVFTRNNRYTAGRPVENRPIKVLSRNICDARKTDLRTKRWIAILNTIPGNSGHEKFKVLNIPHLWRSDHHRSLLTLHSCAETITSGGSSSIEFFDKLGTEFFRSILIRLRIVPIAFSTYTGKWWTSSGVELRTKHRKFRLPDSRVLPTAVVRGRQKRNTNRTKYINNLACVTRSLCRAKDSAEVRQCGKTTGTASDNG